MNDTEKPPHVQRMIVEYRDLQEKIEKLERFLNSAPVMELQSLDRALLNEQVNAMWVYANILKTRLGRAGVNI